MVLLSLIIIALYWILASLTLFLLRNFRAYLKRKPPGFQTILDGANIQLLEYLFLCVVIFHLIGVSTEVFQGKVPQVWAEIISWILLTDQQLFYYQLLLCGIIRLSVVLKWNHVVCDEKVHLWIRRCLILLSSTTTLALIFLGFEHPFAKILQGEDSFKLKLNLVPTLVALSLTVQIISRSIVFIKLHHNQYQESSNELISTGFYTLVFAIIFFSYIIVNVLDLGLRFAFIFGHFSYLTLCIQIFCQSLKVRQFLYQKYPHLKSLKICFSSNAIYTI